MRKRLLTLLLVSMVASASIFTACKDSATNTSDNTSSETTKDAKESSDTKDTTETAAGTENANVPKFEDIAFPDNLPIKPPMAEKDVYGYDNLDKKYSIEILTHNYGKPALPAAEDPINQWLSKKFNLDIQFTAINNADMETTLSTRFASNDEPDIMMLPSRDLAFTLNEQNLLVDAKKIYPYMPQTTKFVTKNMLAWSTASNGVIPFTTKYGIQDGVWGFAVRQDWLKKFNMEPPTSKAALLEYAKACTFNDPDGNGKADTYFMTGAGNGQGFGMLGGYAGMFGNPSATVENGALSHPYFNNIRKTYLSFLKELYDAKVLAPDWYTIEWEKAKSYTMNDKIGMVWYPAGALFDEYANAKNKNPEAINVWHFYKETPIEGGKYDPSGNPGYLCGFAARKFEDEGKLKRVAHMLDTMVIGGENFFQTIQGSTNEVYEAAGIKPETVRETVYNEDGTFYLKNENKFPYESGGKYEAIGPWQHFGLSVTWQMSAPSDDPFDGPNGEAKNKYAAVINSYDRWPNDGLKITLGNDASAAQTGLVDYVNAQELAFVTGKRDFSEWDAFTKEWLGKGGKTIIADIAKCLEVPVPDYAK
jgi:putative aldouronate transport system substrate-binding protein